MMIRMKIGRTSHTLELRGARRILACLGANWEHDRNDWNSIALFTISQT